MKRDHFAEPGNVTHQQKCLHFIVMHRGNLVHIYYTCVPACWDAAVLFDSLEYRPAVITILGIAGEPERKKEGFDCFWAVVHVE